MMAGDDVDALVGVDDGAEDAHRDDGGDGGEAEAVVGGVAADAVDGDDEGEFLAVAVAGEGPERS